MSFNIYFNFLNLIFYYLFILILKIFIIVIMKNLFMTKNIKRKKKN